MISRSQIQTVSASLLATIASALAIWVEPLIAQGSTSDKILATLAGAVLLYGVYFVSFRVLRWLYYRKVAGPWYYVTLSESPSRDQNYATMNVGFTDEGTLSYKVVLYPTRDDLFQKRNASGTATSEAMDYDKARDQLNILYDVQKNADPPREPGRASEPRRRGRLRLNLHDDTLQGRWVSVLERREISQGRMYAARPDDFARGVDAWIERTRREIDAHEPD